jgi:hypothetical protein
VDGFQVFVGQVSTPLIYPSDHVYKQITLIVESGTIRIVFNGKERLNVAADVPLGQVGFCSMNDAAYFDDFLIRPKTNGTNVVHTTIPRPVKIAPDRPVVIYDSTGKVRPNSSCLPNGVYFVKEADGILKKITIIE